MMRNSVLTSSNIGLAVGGPINAALKSIDSTFANLAAKSPIVTDAIQAAAAIRELEHENDMLIQFSKVASTVPLADINPLVAKTEHLRQELKAVEDRKKYYLPPLDETWAEVERARQAYSDRHGTIEPVTPGGAVLLEYVLRTVAAQMDGLRALLAEGRDIEELHRRHHELELDNIKLRESSHEWLFERVQALIRAERALNQAKAELLDLQAGQDARLREIEVYQAAMGAVPK
ncbi:hypothetical protein CALCODRAFT_510077 [Calocera cornea HHB12733]|uniref:Uncharacterized protein n=1 Tax=Calocera cornea HHB12733 TaxID=1353952 RepID=A0A165ESU3_9BASI|nr:hypothetical protein CALCODRAFT_510077 [Calocera cornea HHB12733]